MEHEGWPTFRNADHVYCFRYTPDDQFDWDGAPLWTTNGEWFLSEAFTPKEDAYESVVDSVQGTMPLGANVWRCWDDNAEGVDGEQGDYSDRTMTVTILLNKDEVEEAEQRLVAAVAAESARRAPLAREQLGQMRGVAIEASPGEWWQSLPLNGVYRHYKQDEGWPVLKNKAGVYLYHNAAFVHAPGDKWFIDLKFTANANRAKDFDRVS